jgi:hypothetical protein
LFSILENGFYLINSEYFERGWKSYALANYWIVVPKDFFTEDSRFQDDYYEYKIDEVEKAKKRESVKWWE